MLLVGNSGSGKSEYVKEILSESENNYVIISTTGEYNDFGEVLNLAHLISQNYSQRIKEILEHNHVIFNIDDEGIFENFEDYEMIFDRVLKGLDNTYVVIDDCYFNGIDGQEKKLIEYVHYLSIVNPNNTFFVTQNIRSLLYSSKYELMLFMKIAFFRLDKLDQEFIKESYVDLGIIEEDEYEEIVDLKYEQFGRKIIEL